MTLFAQIFRRQWLVSTIGLFIIVTALVLVHVRFGGLQPTIAYFQGYPVFLVERHSNLGCVHGGTSPSSEFTITNLHDSPTKIVGIETTCGCVAADELPLTIEANRATTLTLRINVSPKIAEAELGNRFVHRATIFFDKSSPPICLSIEGVYVY